MVQVSRYTIPSMIRKLVEFGTGSISAAEREITSEREELAANSASNICVMPWINLYFAADGKVAPCCEFAGDIGTLENATIGQIWSGKAIGEIRERFLRGENVKECWKCWDREKREGNSLRLQKNAGFPAWAEKLHDYEVRTDCAPPAPVALDLRFSNLCNFKCRTCWHGASSKWFREAKILGSNISDKAVVTSFETASELIAQLDDCVDYLEEIYFAGGEPLLMAEHYALLKLLHERGNHGIRLNYNTNLSVLSFNGQSICELWSKFDDISVEVSIDGAHETGELIRKGLKWDIFIANLKQLKALCPHIYLRFGITVSVLNIFSLADLLETLESECGVTPNEIFPHSLQLPQYYSTQILSADLKEEASRKICDYIARLVEDEIQQQTGDLRLATGLKGIVEYMNAVDLSSNLEQFRQVTKQIDQLRHENTATLIPELMEIL